MITDDNLLLAKPHNLGGEQRIYRFGSGNGLSMINSAIAHAYDFAWEAAVLKNVYDDGTFDDLDYTTELTSDVVVFYSDDEANEFIHRAAKVLA